jgi:hypothetical protein
MLGMVFTELLEMIESAFSFEVADAVIARARVSGAYTSVGDYPDAELLAIVEALSTEVGRPVPELMRIYGEHLFSRFHARFPAFFEAHKDAPSFFQVLESHVHTEVRKLYPTSRPPIFNLSVDPLGHHVLEYRSDRGLVDFALGLIDAGLRHFGHVNATVRAEDLSAGAGTHVRFHLQGLN